MSEQSTTSSNVPTLDQIWSALKPEERIEGARHFWSIGSKSDQARVIVVLAQEMRFREKTLIGMSVDEKAKHLTRFIEHVRLRRHKPDIVRSWLIGAQRSLLAAFVSKLGVPHDNGMVDGEAETPPEVSKFREGIRALAAFPPRVVAVYLGYLLCHQDEFWAPVAEALDAEEWDLRAMLEGQAKPIGASQETPSAKAEPEDNASFTTLDNTLILSAVASAFGQTGALKPEQIIDLVEEVVELNSARHHSLFHRGYVDALFDREFKFHFAGENEERRLWYACGVLFGLLRKDDHERCLTILADHPDLADGLATKSNIRCGTMLLPFLFAPLLEGGRLLLLTDWMTAQVPNLETHKAIPLLINAHYHGAKLLRMGNAAEADMLFEVVEHQIEALDTEDLSDERPLWELHGANERKRAQVLQLQGDFAGAKARLEQLLRSDCAKDLDMANAMADLGLIAGGFRAITAILPSSSNEQQAFTIATALEKGRHCFEEPVRRFGLGAANAHFCLGMLGLLRKGESSMKTADHFRQSLAGMLRRQFAYEPSGMIDWARFGLGISLLESLETSEFQHASDSIGQALEARTRFPIWLWGRALQAASAFDDRTLLETTASALLESREEEALDLLFESGAAEYNPGLREEVLKRLGDIQLPVNTRWTRLSRLLPGALRDRPEHAEHILDQLEGLAFESAEFRDAFIGLLSKTDCYSPAWDVGDAEMALVRMNLLNGNHEAAREVLLRRYYKLRESGEGHLLIEAANVLEELRSLPGCDMATIDELARALRLDEELEAEGEAALKRLASGERVRVLYVGGNETQARYVGDIRKSISAEFPGVEVEFELPGWSSNWMADLDRIRSRLARFHVLVLSNLVRTQFGRQLRKECDTACPWLGSTGKGKDSLSRSIRQAAVFAMRRTLAGNGG